MGGFKIKRGEFKSKYMQIQSLFIVCMILLSMTVSAQGIVTSNRVYSNMKILNINTTNTTVDVPIRIENNSGLAGFELDFQYDSSILTAIEIIQNKGEQDEVLSTGILNDTIAKKEDGIFKVIWSGSSNLTKDGTLFYIRFQVNPQAIGNTKLNISYFSDNTFDENISDVTLTCESVEFQINNENYDPYPIIQFENVKSTVGETVKLSAKLIQINDLENIEVTVPYDNTTFEYLNVVSNSSTTISKIVEQSGKISFTISNIKSTMEGQELFSVEFKSQPTANSGKYPFTAIATGNAGSKKIAVQDGSVMLISSSTSDTALIYPSQPIIGKKGEIIRIPVYIENNKGLMGYKLRFQYQNAEIRPLRVVNGNLFEGSLNDNIGVYVNKFDVLWNHIENQYKNGMLFYIEFEILSDLERESVISVSYSQEDTFDEQYADVVMMCKNANLFLNFLLGDVSTDGKIDIVDYNLMLKHIKGTIALSKMQCAHADVNRDGAIDAFDAALLDHYLGNEITEFKAWYQK